jgi:hypothetical protein
MSTIAEITKDLLVFIVVMFVLLIMLLVVISRMPDDNALKRIFNALAFRVGATLGVGVLAIPIEPTDTFRARTARVGFSLGQSVSRVPLRGTISDAALADTEPACFGFGNCRWRGVQRYSLPVHVHAGVWIDS